MVQRISAVRQLFRWLSHRFRRAVHSGVHSVVTAQLTSPPASRGRWLRALVGESVEDSLQSTPDLSDDWINVRIVDDIDQHSRVHGQYLAAAALMFGDHHVGGQQNTNAYLRSQGAVCKLGMTRTQNHVPRILATSCSR